MFISLVLLSWLSVSQERVECEDVVSCRQAAQEAAERKAFEVFHDLAWRAVQKGRRNDPELMLLLARAQSLSGRPADALVMLKRLAEIGDARDAITSDDFERVRALPGWADVEAAILAASETRPAEPKTATRARASAKKVPPEKPAAAIAETLAPSPKAEPSKPADPPKVVESAKPVGPPRRAPPLSSAGEVTIRLPASPIEAIGLAYDTVSRRFVVGDRRRNKLIVADEIFKRVNDLIGAGSGGFGTLSAIEIDRRRGDLWVTSAGVNGNAAVHKLQLVSGRVLARIDVPEDWGPAALNDISMSETGELLLVDATGSRLLTLAASAQDFARVVALDLPSPVSIAPAGPVVYVAHAEGLAVLDLKSRSTTAIRAAKGVLLTGLRRIRWYQGSLVAIQDDPEAGTARLVRIRLNQTRQLAARRDPLDDQVPEDGSVLTISENSVYYLARATDGPTIRRVPLR